MGKSGEYVLAGFLNIQKRHTPYTGGQAIEGDVFFQLAPCATLSMYSFERVSTFTVSPVFTKSGT